MDKKYFEIDPVDWCSLVQSEYEALWIESGQNDKAVKLFKYGNSLNNEDDTNLYNPSKALKFYKLSADLGYAPAMEEYANLITSEEEGIEQDIDKAMKLLNKATDLGYLPAYATLARLYEQGVIGERNVEKAVELYKVCANANDPSSQFALASLLDQDLGKSLEAAFWYSQAIVGAIGRAANSLGLMYALGRGEGTIMPESEPFAIDYFRALSCFLHAYRLGWKNALTNIADCYFNGYGIEMNKDIAIEMYIEASDYDTRALDMLGGVYLSGEGGVEPNIAKTIDYWTKGAEQGDSDCMLNLGDIYSGEFGDNHIDLDKALYWYQRGAELGDEDCQLYIDSHERGEW